jgi:hypothetical protein
MPLVWTPPRPSKARFLWTLTLGCDSVIAEDEDHAWKVWAEHTGETLSEYEADTWDQPDPKVHFPVYFEGVLEVEAQLKAASEAGLSLREATVVSGTQGARWMRGERASGTICIKAYPEWWAGLPCGFLCSADW